MMFLAAKTMKKTVFWDLAVLLIGTLNMKAAGLSETSVPVYKTTRRGILEEKICHIPAGTLILSIVNNLVVFSTKPTTLQNTELEEWNLKCQLHV